MLRVEIPWRNKEDKELSDVQMEGVTTSILVRLMHNAAWARYWDTKGLTEVQTTIYITKKVRVIEAAGAGATWDKTMKIVESETKDLNLNSVKCVAYKIEKEGWAK